MEQSKYSLIWDAYTNNICKGLSGLQQSGEFVDMTLAADGHFVKVHKMVMSLISPYIKDLIASADCAHPVIFLNQMSYETLKSILEYVYTGQVLVEKKQITSFMEACQALHIRGFENLDKHKILPVKEEYAAKMLSKSVDDDMHHSSLTSEHGEMTEEHDDDNNTLEDYAYLESDGHEEKVVQIPISEVKNPEVQFSLSNHGHLQLILNRYVYNLRYSARKSGQRTWQCVDGHCKGKKCPARVVTHHNKVIGRTKPHNHPHHDKKILKKVQAGTIFTALHEAEHEMHCVQIQKEKDYGTKCRNVT